MARIKLLNTYIDNLTMQEAVDATEKLICKTETAYVVTPNLDHIVTLEKDSEFAEIYSNADLILADGKPLIWISKLLKTPIAAKAAKNLCQKYKGLKVVGTYSPPFGFEKNENELRIITEMIHKAKPDILAVSLGSPKGEKYIYRNLKENRVPLSISIGATIDFEAGNVKRAPKWLSMDWNGFIELHRILKD